MTTSSAPAAGRTFLVTGGNTGIGLATAIALARDGARVYIGCRSAGPGEAAADRIKAASGSDTVWLLPLDLASLDSVRACAGRFLDQDEPLHVLVNNAGVGGQRGVTADGFEQHFGVNHLGHFALTQLLLGRLTASGPGARVVTVSSAAHYNARGIDFTALRRPTATFAGAREYAVSKLCNVLFTQELARRRAGTGVTCYALHPGVVASDIWRRVPRLARPFITRRMLTTEQGAVTSVHCATSPAVAAESGLFYDNCAVREPSPLATRQLAELLWKRSAEWTGVGLFVRTGGPDTIAAFAIRLARTHIGGYGGVVPPGDNCGSAARSGRDSAEPPSRRRGAWFGLGEEVTSWDYGPSCDAPGDADAGQAGGRDSFR